MGRGLRALWCACGNHYRIPVDLHVGTVPRTVPHRQTGYSVFLEHMVFLSRLAAQKVLPAYHDFAGGAPPHVMAHGARLSSVCQDHVYDDLKLLFSFLYYKVSNTNLL